VIILAGTIRIGTGKRDDALELIETMIEATRAEPGCLDYRFSFDVSDDHLVHIFELFEDEAALAAHRASPHMQVWRANNLGISDRSMREYQASTSRDI
jgi:quinol monooxygenase YgiN